MGEPYTNSYASNFTIPSELYSYMCGSEELPEGVKKKPVCGFPYINKGWYLDGNATKGGDGAEWDDVVMKDCSITFAETSGGAYDTKCLIYGAVNFVFLLVCFQYLWVIRARRKASKRKSRNLMEIMTLWNVAITSVHMICCVDYNAWRGTYTYWMISMFKGFIAGTLIVIAGLLITSWVSVIDGGKTKQTPKWCSNLLKFTYFFSYFSECGLGTIEILLTEDGFTGGFDSTVNSMKNLSFACLLFVWGGVAVSYGNKITGMLKAGGGGSADKVIQKYLRAIVVCIVLGSAYKLLFCAIRIQIGGTIFEFPPCSTSFIDIIGLLFLTIQFVILMAQNPNTGKAKKAQTKVSTTTSTTTSSTEP